MTLRHTFGLSPAATATKRGAPGAHDREFLDFVVDDDPLRDVVSRRLGGDDAVKELPSLLVTNWPAALVTDAVWTLLGETPPELADGRIPLYVCRECGDLGCGAVTADVERADDTVTWRRFGWQNNWEPEVVDTEPFAGIGPFVFARGQYEATLRAVLA